MTKPAKPNHCVLMLRLLSLADRVKTWRGKLGLFLLVSNVPIGLVGAAIFTLLYAHYEKAIFISLALLIYAFSWLMLLAGTLLCGRNAVKNIKHKGHIRYLAWKYLRHKRSRNHPPKELANSNW